MNKHCLLLGFISILITASCTTSRVSTSNLEEDKELEDVVKLMTGHFSSAQQSKEDTTFYDISLAMHQIWENDAAYKWLYVEQAATKNILKPYRQRVYRLSKTRDGKIESRVYKLPNEASYIHAWKTPDLFDQLTPEELIIREGCSVFLEKISTNCYYGSTKDKACKSTLRGATYATSTVTVCPNQIVSWDQGWNESDVQVWGAEKEGYIFRKILRQEIKNLTPVHPKNRAEQIRN